MIKNLFLTKLCQTLRTLPLPLRRGFDQAIPPHQAAPDSAGYTHKLKYTEHTAKPKRKPYRRMATWFNQPW